MIDIFKARDRQRIFFIAQGLVSYSNVVDNDKERFLLAPRGSDVIFCVCNDLITTVHNFITWAGKFDHLGSKFDHLGKMQLLGGSEFDYLGSKSEFGHLGSSHSDRFWG